MTPKKIAPTDANNLSINCKISTERLTTKSWFNNSKSNRLRINRGKAGMSGLGLPMAKCWDYRLQKTRQDWVALT